MTAVLCDEHNCKFNQLGLCQLAAIHIVSYRDAWDCSQFERNWSKQAVEEVEREARSAQTQPQRS